MRGEPICGARRSPAAIAVTAPLLRAAPRFGTGSGGPRPFGSRCRHRGPSHNSANGSALPAAPRGE